MALAGVIGILVYSGDWLRYQCFRDGQLEIVGVGTKRD